MLNREYLWLGVFLSLLTGGFVFVMLAKFHRIIDTGITTSNITIENKHVKNGGLQQTHSKKLGNEKRKNILGLYQFEHPVNSFLYTYSMLLLVSLPKLPEGWALRVFTGWWWIYCILLVVSYRASMTSILANPNLRYKIE